MEFKETLNKRKSIRDYDKDKKVEQALIEEMIEAAILAPSWKNGQTSRYYVVSSEDKLQELKESCLSDWNKKCTKNAPVLIITSFVKDRVGFEKTGEASNELGNGWGIYDLGLQNANLLLKATELGLDTLVMGLRDADKIREILEISENEIIVSVIAVGYGKEDVERPARKPVEAVAKFI